MKIKHVAKSYKGNKRMSKKSEIVYSYDSKEVFIRSIRSLAGRSTLHTNVVSTENGVAYSSWDASDISYVDIYRIMS